MNIAFFKLLDTRVQNSKLSTVILATASSTVYVISFPVASYLCSPVNVYDQFPAMLFVSSASSATTCSATTPLVSLLITCNLILFNVYHIIK